MASLSGLDTDDLAESATKKLVPYASSKYDLSAWITKFANVETEHVYGATGGYSVGAWSSVYADGVFTRVALQETTTPTAQSGFGRVYTKTDNKLYFQSGDGAEHEVAYV